MMEIEHHPAECALRCEDHNCPYAHFDTWVYMGVTYYEKEDAVAAQDRREGTIENG